MPRDEEDTVGGRARASHGRAVRVAGHKAGGGHTKGPGRTPQQHAVKQAIARQKGKPSFWDHDDDDDDDGGGTVDFQEFPKMIYPHGRKNPKTDPWVIVNSASEEAEAMANGSVAEAEADKRERLLAIGEVKGLKLDGRWSLDKLEAAITAAGHDPGLDPAK